MFAHLCSSLSTTEVPQSSSTLTGQHYLPDETLNVMRKSPTNTKRELNKFGTKRYLLHDYLPEDLRSLRIILVRSSLFSCCLIFFCELAPPPPQPSAKLLNLITHLLINYFDHESVLLTSSCTYTIQILRCFFQPYFSCAPYLKIT